jgi:hypothetical protein
MKLSKIVGLSLGISAISLLLLSNIAIGQVVTAAVSPGEIPGADALEIQESPIEEPQGIIDAIRGVAKWIYIIFFIIAIMFILFAAFNYLSGGGDAEKAKTAHNQIKYAAIAIAVALLAVGFEIIVKNFLQSGGGNGYGGDGYYKTPTKPDSGVPGNGYGGDGYYKTYDSWRWLPFGGDQTPPPPERMPRTIQ